MSDGTEGKNASTTTTRLPDIRAEVREDGTGEISIDGVIERVRMANLAEAGAAITTRIAELAGSVGQPVPVQVRDPDGVWSLLIHADGLVDEAPGARTTSGRRPDAAEPRDDRRRPRRTRARRPERDAPTPTCRADPAGDRVADRPSRRRPSDPDARRRSAATSPVPASSDRPAARPRPRPADRRRRVRRPPGRRTRRLPRPPRPRTPVAGVPTGDAPVGPVPAAPDARRPARRTAPRRRRRTGGARLAGRASAGSRSAPISPGPGRDERRRRIAAASVRRTLDGPKTIVIINPKGGAHKTTATMLLAATFGLQRGGYTLAWDNNETRGTLGWRSSHADHTRTAVDLLNALPALGPAGTVRIGDLDGFVRTQPTEQFDVLASDENSASASSVDADSFTSLHQVLSRFYRVLVIDTGNNMRASNWQAAVGAADQIVVVSTVREDTAQSAAWALDALRATGHDEAVRRAVTVLSAPEPKVDKDLQKRLRSHFGALTRAVLDVPHDKALVAGGPIDYDALSTTTRDAWLRVTAVVADGL